MVRGVTLARLLLAGAVLCPAVTGLIEAADPVDPCEWGARALLVSMSQYDVPQWGDLDSTLDDVNAVRDALPDKKFEVQILKSPKAQKLKEEIHSFFGQCAQKKGDRLFFYFAGHGYSERLRLSGSENASAFLIARDTPYLTQQPQHGSGRNPPMEDTAVSVKELVQKARDSAATDVLIVLDACRVANVVAAGVRISGPNYKPPGRASCMADVPEEIADVPEEIADVPEEIADVPEEIADVPEEIADVPEEIADVPENGMKALREDTNSQMGARNIITSGFNLADVSATSAFANAFAEGLGGGDADGYVSDFNPGGVKDAKVDAKELVNFVHDRIQTKTAKPQTPQIFCVGERLFAFAIPDS